MEVLQLKTLTATVSSNFTNKINAKNSIEDTRKVSQPLAARKTLLWNTHDYLQPIPYIAVYFQPDKLHELRYWHSQKPIHVGNVAVANQNAVYKRERRDFTARLVEKVVFTAVATTLFPQ